MNRWNSTAAAKAPGEASTATCRSCGHHGPLASYETTLWFVVIFIPVIPLGRKRIIDECPRCRRHYVAKADEYAMASQLAVSEARQKYSNQPNVESALEAHAKMLGFHQHEEADALRTDALAKFPRDAALRCAFAHHLNQMARYAEATPLYEEAYKIDPTYPEARVGMAFIRMNQGELDEARKLLDHLEKPGAGQVYPLGPLETLAVQYQKQGRHQEAIELFRHLLNEFPDAAQNHSVRKMIRTSEKKLGTFETVLPERTGTFLSVFNPWSQQYSSGQKTLAFIGLVTFLIVVGLGTNTIYLGQHRTLHLLSGLDQPVQVQIDNRTPVTVASHERVTVPEGTHRVSVTGPITAQYEVRMDSPFWSRLFRNPVWIVNFGGTAALVQLQYHYAVNPIPPGVTILSGQTVVSLPHVDYPFVDPPNSLDLSSNNQVLTKSGLMTAPVDPESLASKISNLDQALTYLEAFLPTRPQDGMLFYAYQARVKKEHAIPRGEAYLKAGLDRRPIEMNWHRTYQNFLEEAGRNAELIALYDAAIAKEPGNGTLLYLRARIEGDPEQSSAILERAKTADPASPWPWYSLGYRSMSRGDWPAAVAEYRQAQQRGFDKEMLRSGLHTAMLANGEGDAVIAERRAELQAQPTNGTTLALLLDALIVQGQIEAAKQELAAWKGRNPAGTSADLAAGQDLLQQLLDYEIGDFAALEQRLASATEPNVQTLRAAMWLAIGKPERLASDSALQTAHFNGEWDLLALSVAFHAAGNEAEANAWRTKACEQLSKHTHTEQQAAQWLSSDDTPEFRVIEQAVLDPNQKMILLCALAQKFPQLHDQCAALARKLTVNRTPPYHLVARIFPPSS